MTKKYDDASWHYEGDFPEGLPPEAGGTHIGMFFAWLALNDLLTPDGELDLESLKKNLSERTSTPGAEFLKECDGKLLDHDLTSSGAAFTEAYFSYENPDGYVMDYANILTDNLPSVYHVADSWETFDCLRPVLDERFDQWKRGTLKLGEKK